VKTGANKGDRAIKIDFDEAKRQWTLENRGLDFLDAAKVFEERVFVQEDTRYDYLEPRFQTYGCLNKRLIMFAWTEIPDGI